MTTALMRAYSEPAMLENARLVVFTRGQWNGLRATIRRLGLA